MRELLKRAKTLLSLININGNTRSGESINLYRAIEAELAKPEPEPVAWECTRGGFTELTVVHPSKVWGNGFKNVKKLYYQPPAQEPEPLTRDEIDSILNECVELEGYYDNARGESKRWVLKDEHKFARAIEQKVWSKMK